jgi:hypothetical protein
MTIQGLIFFFAFEIIGLLVVTRMWAKRWHRRLVVRLIWSAVLLLPAVGLLIYFFLRETPDEHPYDTDTMRDSAEASSEGGGDHY